MAQNTLPVPLSSFSTFTSVLDREIPQLFLAVDRAFGHVHLTQCWYEDEHCDCRELATVHHLGTDFAYCERHFQAVSRG